MLHVVTGILGVLLGISLVIVGVLILWSIFSDRRAAQRRNLP